MRKRLLAIVATAAMLVAMAPAMAFADAATVSTADELVSKAKLGDVVFANDITVAAGSGGYSKAGITPKAGSTVDGNGKTLTVTGANATWDCAIYTSGGTIKNLTIKGAMRGIFTAGCSSDIIVDNCVLEDVIYTFSSDVANSNYSVTFKNSTLNGWTSYTSGYKSVTFENCKFGEGNGYAYLRPYDPTTFEDCEFEEGYEMDATRTDDLELVNCYVGDTLITSDNIEELLGVDPADITVYNCVYTDDAGEIQKREDHVFGNELKKDADNHWFECDCGEKEEVAPHKYVNGICECGAKEPAKPEASPNTGDNSMAPITVAGLALAAMAAAVVATRRRTN